MIKKRERGRCFGSFVKRFNNVNKLFRTPTLNFTWTIEAFHLTKKKFVQLQLWHFCCCYCISFIIANHIGCAWFIQVISKMVLDQTRYNINARWNYRIGCLNNWENKHKRFDAHRFPRFNCDTQPTSMRRKRAFLFIKILIENVIDATNSVHEHTNNEIILAISIVVVVVVILIIVVTTHLTPTALFFFSWLNWLSDLFIYSQFCCCCHEH